MPGLRQPKKLDAEKLWTYALRTLGGRGMSSGEIRSKLQRRAENAKDVDAVLGRLKDYGYLNDQKFAEHYAAARLENEGLGKQRVLRDLRQKRVAPALAEKVVRETYEASDETALVEDYLARKYRNVKLGEMLKDPSKLASVFRKLRYAGFGAGTAIRVLRRYSERAEELEESDESASPSE
jgi:regulatory protein